MELKVYIPASRVFLAMMLQKLMFASPEHAKWRPHKKLFMFEELFTNLVTH